MNVAVIQVSGSRDGALESIAKGIASSVQARGHQVEVSDNRGRLRSSLGGFGYVFLLTEPVGWGWKLPPRLSEALAEMGGLAGKRSAAVLRNRSIATAKAMRNLIDAMESQGMVVNYDIIAKSSRQSGSEAERAPIERD